MKTRILNLIKTFAFALSLATSAQANTVDLRQYLPDSNQVILSKQGAQHARYTFTKAPAGFLGLYTSLMNLNKPGSHYVWQKEYVINGNWCLKTYAVLFLGDDGSVTEVGDWLAQGSSCAPSIAFGYRDAYNRPTGLVWAPPGGLTGAPTINEASIYSQAYPGAAYANSGHRTYSKTGVVEVLPSMVVGGYSFQNVVHLVMYHGTRAPTPVQVRCPGSPIKADGVYYQSYKDFNSYAIELWLAPGVGVIKESTTFIEDASYWGRQNCTGQIFDPANQWWTDLSFSVRTN